jgi:tetratricopeptide (TPR) repeat protein
VWGAFAEEAERAQAWTAERDALVAMYGVKRDPAIAERGALAALRANDAETALRLARAARRPGEATPRPEMLAAELEALARLGRGAEAERALATSGVSESVARGHARTIAWAWVRSGDVAKARAALANAPLDAEDAVAGWLALFEGDLTIARRALRQGDASSPQAVAALALLSRTSAQKSVTIGRAFLQLVRADSVSAAAEFERAAGELIDAAPLLLARAARVETARGNDARAVALWTRVATDFTSAPEAAEARLEWGRALRRRGDRPGAREQFEHLILTYPGSALVPQARRELDALPAGRAESSE